MKSLKMSVFFTFSSTPKIDLALNCIISKNAMTLVTYGFDRPTEGFTMLSLLDSSVVKAIAPSVYFIRFPHNGCSKWDFTRPKKKKKLQECRFKGIATFVVRWNGMNILMLLHKNLLHLRMISTKVSHHPGWMTMFWKCSCESILVLYFLSSCVWLCVIYNILSIYGNCVIILMSYNEYKGNTHSFKCFDFLVMKSINV